MVSLRRVPLVALLALLPAAVYTAAVDLVVVIALVNVVLIAASLYLMVLPSEGTVKAASA